MIPVRLILASLLALLITGGTTRVTPAVSAQAGPRPRVIVSTDIGGTDPDDFQSMVHFLVYADMFDVEGLISSPYGPGRRAHILQVIDRYATDYPNLKTYSDRYPTPDALRRVTKQGAIDSAAGHGVGRSTEGSDWIVRAARRNDPRPLWVLVWGGIDDLAQALHDAPDILPKLRVYFIGGPNKMWSVDAYNYIEQHHPALWIVEANATYRGWFTGGNQAGEWGNTAFVAAHVAGRGALGRLLRHAAQRHDQDGRQSVCRLPVARNAGRPVAAGMGREVRSRCWDGRKTIFERLTTEADKAEVVRRRRIRSPGACRHDQRRTPRGWSSMAESPPSARNEGRVLRFRFSPRDAKVWPYVIRSDSQASTASRVASPPSRRQSSEPVAPSSVHPHWWIDDPDPAAAEGVHPGAKSVSRWREAFLRDFAARMLRCASPR